MATRTALRTRLQNRLGLGVVSAVEQDRLDEALNAGIGRAISDGVPGLAHDVLTGTPFGELALTSAAVTAGSSDVTLGGADPTATNVMPHDILVVDVSGTETKFLIRDVKDANEVSIGVVATASLNGGSDSKIIRRSLPLPTAGQVISVYRHSTKGSNTRQLVYEPVSALRQPFKTGTPAFFEQRYSRVTDTSFVSLWPAPDDTNQYTVVQTRFGSTLSTDGAELQFPEEAIDAILERARWAYLVWIGNVGQVDATLSNQAVRDVSDVLKNTSNKSQVFVKE